MRTGLRLLAVLLFLAHGLLAPFWIMCHAPGPGGHDRLEFAWDDCCSGDSPASRTCKNCHDEKVDAPETLKPHEAGVPAPAALTLVLPRSPVILPLGNAVPRRGLLPDHPGDPPRFLILRTLRI